MPGTHMFGGFYTVRFQLGEAAGRSVMYARAGKRSLRLTAVLKLMRRA
jgi:hypothetical protein